MSSLNREATLRLVELVERNSWLGEEQLEHGVLSVDEVDGCGETAAARRSGAASLLRLQRIIPKGSDLGIAGGASSAIDICAADVY